LNPVREVACLSVNSTAFSSAKTIINATTVDVGQTKLTHQGNPSQNYFDCPLSKIAVADVF